jgi:large subunit ribosomal protein L22
MAVQAQAKYVRVAPRKAREAADLIRGKSVAEARSTLFFANRTRRDVAVVLNSGRQRREQQRPLGRRAVVKEARVEWPTKRWQFRAMGREPNPQAQQPHHHRVEQGRSVPSGPEGIRRFPCRAIHD